MQIEDLPILPIASLLIEAQLQLILDVRQRRRCVAERHTRRAVPKIDKLHALHALNNEQLKRLAQLLGLENTK